MKNSLGFLSLCLQGFIGLTYIFLYVPIAVVILFSFNHGSYTQWQGFSSRWYVQLSQTPEIFHALKNSLIVAGCAVTLSLTLALLLVFFTASSRLKQFLSLFYGNLLVPEIIMVSGLLIFFTLITVPLGLITLIVGHTLLGLGYAVPLLHDRFAALDYGLIEASLDLGATYSQTFFRVVLPLMVPALFAAGVLVFIVSFDDFLVAFFCSGSSAQTLPLYIFAMIRTGASPVINALSTLLIIGSSIIAFLLSISKIRTRIF